MVHARCETHQNFTRGCGASIRAITNRPLPSGPFAANMQALDRTLAHLASLREMRQREMMRESEMNRERRMMSMDERETRVAAGMRANREAFQSLAAASESEMRRRFSFGDAEAAPRGYWF